MSEDILRIAHESNLIEPVPKHADIEQPPSRWEEQVQQEIENRKRIINGLEMEIKELEELIND